ncbi:hypothetical protein CYY_010275 [Polysphondylium violaceum]|uniref:Uncharacterized protein n=1 Tax=Polysphondylium violaceum TaxID=133409 RepID=A0A8J4UNU7_9MYCE|nr:hypothetical protein CYY_010275 [Polysphondylium violaceum]
MLSVPSLPSPLSLIPDSVMYLKVQQQQKAVGDSYVAADIRILLDRISAIHNNNYIPHDIPNTVKEVHAVLMVCQSVQHDDHQQSSE